MVVDDERLDHARLVECSGRSRGRVGQEHRSLDVDGAHRSLDDCGNVRVAGIPSSSELLESVEDFVLAVLRGNDPQRGVLQFEPVRSRLPWPEPGIARTKALDGEHLHGAQLRCPRSGR